MNNTFQALSRCYSISSAFAAIAIGSVALTSPLLFSAAEAASKIAVLVNNVPITTNDISRRAAFFKLRKMKGNHRKLAREELIVEAMKMQEARRRRIRIPQKQIDAAYLRFAKGNKIPPKIMSKILNRSGVTVRGFKQYIRANMTWQSLVAARYRSEASPKVKNPLDHLHGGKGASSKNTTEYTLQQIVFVVPKAKLKARSQARMSEANNFRARYAGCEKAFAQAASLKNVSVLKRGRIQGHEIPDRWRKEVEVTKSGKTTRPLKTEKGVEMLAVCKTRQVRSKLQGDNADIFSSAGGAQQGATALEKKYIAELRKRAVIKNR